MTSTVRTWPFLAGAFASLALLVFEPAKAVGEEPARPYETTTTSSGWQVRWEPYGWLVGFKGDVTARGRTFDVDATFFDIVENSDSLFALMSYMEARKGPLSFYLDTVYADLTLSQGDVRYLSGPFGMAEIEIDAAVGAMYRFAIIEAGAAYEFARLPVTAGHYGAYSAFDVIIGGRYWYQDVEVQLALSAGVDPLPLGLDPNRNLALARARDLQWVDPIIGLRLRHSFGKGEEFVLKGDIGGFNAASDFTWQVAGVYSFEFAKRDEVTFAGALGYRVLSVDYEEGRGIRRAGIDGIYYGPILGLSMRY